MSLTLITMLSSSLKTLTIPYGVAKIGGHAFSYCTALTEIVLPNSLTKIYTSAFSECFRLATITFQGTKKEWKAIEKGTDWKKDTGSFTVRCTDGSISKLFA